MKILGIGEDPQGPYLRPPTYPNFMNIVIEKTGKVHFFKSQSLLIFSLVFEIQIKTFPSDRINFISKKDT